MNPTSVDSVGASERESEANPTKSPTPKQVAEKRRAHANADTISRPHKSQAAEKGTVSLGIGARTRARTCISDSEGRGSGGARGSDAGHEGR